MLKYNQPGLLKFIITWGLFWITALGFYYKTHGAGFVTDTLGWLETYKHTGWQGLAHAFGDKSLHFIYHLFFFSLYKLAGTNGFIWMIVFVTLHSLAATLSVLLFNKVFAKSGLKSATYIAFCGGLLFLLSPYQTEVVVWYSCIHYPVCVVFTLLAFWSFIRYLETVQNKYILLFYACYLLSVFALEIGFCFPLMVGSFILLYPYEVFYTKRNDIKLSLIFVFPSAFFVAAYFILTKLLRGNFAGHYGDAAHFNFDISLLMGNFSKYFAKIFGLAQFVGYNKREILYHFFETKQYAYILLALLIFFALSAVIYRKRLSPAVRIGVLLFTFFGLGLLPVLNLFFTYIVNIECDRLGYFGTIFAYQLIALILFSLFRQWGWVLLGAYFLLSIKYLVFNISSWRGSKFINQSLVEDFRWYQAPHVVLLNVPDNFGGAYLFRSFPPGNSFAETLVLERGENIKPVITEILEYNMNSTSDSVSVEKLSENELKVTFSQWGNWWWRNGIGVKEYFTDDFSVKVDEWGHSYNLLFKRKIPGTVYIYQCGKEWREVKDY